MSQRLPGQVECLTKGGIGPATKMGQCARAVTVAAEWLLSSQLAWTLGRYVPEAMSCTRPLWRSLDGLPQHDFGYCVSLFRPLASPHSAPRDRD
jgi:hypothetical protein